MMGQHDAYCPEYGEPYDHPGLCREQPGYPVQPAPDPLYDEAYAASWLLHDRAARRRPRHARLELVAVIAIGLALLVVGFVAGQTLAAPRSAQPAIPAATFESETLEASTPGASGNLAGQSGAPRSGMAVEAAAKATREAPAPAGGVGAPLRGIASWYGAVGMIGAAGPGLRVGRWRGTLVTVSANGRSVTVRLSDWCACPRRLIDLSDDAFRQLAPLSVGLVAVTIRTGAAEPGGPVATPPATDVGP